MASAETSRLNTGGRLDWLLPAGTAAVGVGALMYVRGFGGRIPNVIPLCGFHALTGLWCPGCGLTRGTRALMHGDIQQSLGYNLFTPLVLALFLYTWLAWALPRLSGPNLPHLTSTPRVIWRVVGVAVLLFTIARNLPIAPLAALAP
jgi:hypothetical protein